LWFWLYIVGSILYFYSGIEFNYSFFFFFFFFFFFWCIGRIWAGHNILRFDCARIREAFANIGRPGPEPKGTIDSLALLTQKFGRRAGDMKV
jgi:hypothetical protein